MGEIREARFASKFEKAATFFIDGEERVTVTAMRDPFAGQEKWESPSITVHRAVAFTADMARALAAALARAAEIAEAWERGDKAEGEVTP